LHHRAEIAIGQRVAVHDQKPFGIEQGQRAFGAAGGPEHERLPRVAHLHTEVGSVADQARDGFGPVMQVEDDASNARAVQPTQNTADDRLACDWQGGFGADVGERTQASGETGGQDERRPIRRVRNQVLTPSANSMSLDVTPCAAQCCRNSVR
jgi:hypothetical protein